MNKKKRDIVIGARYTEEQLREMSVYELLTIAAALAVQKRPDGKYGSREEMIPEILKAQEMHDELTTPYCEMCGSYNILRERAHICSEGDKSRENILMLCPTCHRMFDTHLKPRLHKALKRFGAKHLPVSWEKSIYQQAFEASSLAKEARRKISKKKK